MASFGGMVPLKVHTLLGFWVGRPGWNFSGIEAVGSIPQLNCESTPGLYVVWAVACACDASMATLGANCGNPNLWCAQMGPGGLPSMGPVSPGTTPGSAGSNNCWVVFASAVGAG